MLFRRAIITALLLAACLATTAGAERILLVDKWMLDPIAFKPFFDHFGDAGHDFQYRRFHPTLVEDDASRYDVIMVAGGIHPRPAATHMRDEEVALLKEFVEQGGTVVLLASSGATDQWMFNKLLQGLKLKLQIEGDSIMESTGYKSTLVPASYYLNLPYMHVPEDTPLGEGLPEWLPAGRMGSILIGTMDVEVPVVSRKTAMRGLGWEFGEGDSPERGFVVPYSGEPTSAYGGMVAANAGEGHVIIAPRFMFNMNGFTGRWSDKPISKPYDLAANRQFEKNFCNYVAAIASGGYTPKSFVPLTRLDRIPKLEKPKSLDDERFLAEPLRKSAPKDCFDNLEPFDTIAPQSLSFLDGEKIKSGFVGLPSGKGIDSHLDHYEEMDLNLLYVMRGRELYRARDDEEKLAAEKENMLAYAAAAKERDLKVMFGGASPERAAWRNKVYDTKVVDGMGRYYELPSPFDKDSWRDTIVEPGRLYAEVAAEYPDTVVGCFWDLELYGNPEIIVSEAIQFDTATFVQFLDSRRARLAMRGLLGDARLLDQKMRWKWLEEHGLLKDYYGFLADQFEDMVSDTIREFDRVSKDFRWGFYTAGIPQSWYYQGLYRAVQDYQGEVLVVSYEARGQQQASYYKSKGIDLIHAPGVLMGIPEGQEWVEFLTMSMEHEPGYWLFPVQVLTTMDKWREMRNDSAMNEHPTVIKQYVREANDQFPKP